MFDGRRIVQTSDKSTIAIRGSPRFPLADVLDPIGVRHIVADVTDINVSERKIACTIDGASKRCRRPTTCAITRK